MKVKNDVNKHQRFIYFGKIYVLGFDDFGFVRMVVPKDKLKSIKSSNVINRAITYKEKDSRRETKLLSDYQMF